jgi:Fatty acid hydroxylase superfamily
VSVPAVDTARAIELGRAKKRNNALVAILCGVLPAAILGFYFPLHWPRWASGFIVGLIWGNFFEYAYHRWLLHRPRSIFAKGHLEHHRTTGGPDQAEHINFGRNAWNVVALFVSNGIVLLCLEASFHLRIAPGVLLGWTIYLIVLEEIHWRFHMEEWVPRGLRSARSYHLSHHDIPNTRYNVFLPLFDVVFDNAKVALPNSSLQATQRSRAR